MKINGKGGAHTNLHGLNFEQITSLASCIKRDLGNKYKLIPHKFTRKKPKPDTIGNSKDYAFDIIKRANNKRIGIVTKQNRFYNVLWDIYGLKNANSKKWKPDEALFNFKTNTVYIVEKKWQSEGGSVDEKVFGFVNKRRLYQKDFNQLKKEPKPTVQFCTLLNSSWWINGNHTSYQDYFDALRSDGIKIFFDKYQYWWFGLQNQ